MDTDRISSAQRGESVAIKTEVETDQTGESVAIKTQVQQRESVSVIVNNETDSLDQLVDMTQHNNIYERDCHFKPSASTTDETSSHGTTHLHPADLEWETMWLQTAPIKFEADVDQRGRVPSDSVIHGNDLNQTSPTHSDDTGTGHVHVKTEPDDEGTHTPMSTIQQTKSVSDMDDADKPEHTVFPVGLFHNVYVASQLAENVLSSVMSEKCDASNCETCPHTCVTRRQTSISDCLSSAGSVVHSSHHQTNADRATVDTHTSLSNLKIQTQTSRDDKRYTCIQCDAAFRQSSNLKRHMRMHTGDKPFICEECNAAFRQSSHLKYHMRTHTGDKPYVCKECGAAFIISSNLKAHMRIHTGDKPYACDKCDAAFSQQSNLKSHILTHTGDKSHVCEQCNAAFKLRGNLKKHMRTHSSPCTLIVKMRKQTGGKQYVCEQCDATFTQSYHLKRHMLTHTGDKPYPCEHCDAAFSTFSNLKRHVRTHTGDKPYVCNRCDAAFAQSNNLDVHMRIHTGDKPYACTQCAAAFIQFSHLIKHMQRTHKDLTFTDGLGD